MPKLGSYSENVNIKIISFAIIFLSITLILYHTVNAQLGNSTVSQILGEKYGHRNYFDNATNTNYEIVATVHVNYESPSTVLMSGGLIESQFSRFNSDLWEAMDLVKNQYGFKLQNVMTSGLGSVGNPTVVYILMTK
jgi:hypothetical protein